jgi:DeoR/GlpR family transcriptional regulator of sugar metabolism
MPDQSISLTERYIMTPATRRDAILRQAQSGQRLAVEQLSAEFATSRETIRRDLAELDRKGLLRRVHGGATQSLRSVEEGPFHDRMRQQVGAKRAIARYVAETLLPGDSLFIDTGSTTLFLAEELALRNGLIIITNSADIATLCQKGAGNRVVLIGGEFRGPGREAVGPMAVAQISQLRAARAVLTVASVTERGIFDIDPQEAEVARAMIAQADEVVVLADHSKMGRAGVFEVCPMARVGRIVTDTIDKPLRDAVEVVGVRVSIVGAD